MGLFTRDIKTFDDLFVHQLQDVYYAENQIAKTLPKMMLLATAPELKRAFETHLQETKTHITRLEQVFKQHNLQVKGVDCPAIDGIVKEGNEVSGEVADKAVLDAALIAAAQAVEHYEIARYGTMIAWAEKLGRHDSVALLRQTLEEEKATDGKLTALAKNTINPNA